MGKKRVNRSHHNSVRQEVASSLSLLVTSAIYTMVILLLCNSSKPVSTAGPHTAAG